MRGKTVFEPAPNVRHEPFFLELASLDEHDPSWRSVSAGLVVLRLVDAWMEEGKAAVLADGWGMRSVEAAIEEMPSGSPARTILRSIVTALRGAEGSDMHAVAPRLMAYARSLDLDAKWDLAADVYQTVLAHVHPTEDSDVAINAHMRLAFCQRSAGALDAAASSYESARVIAASVDDMFGVLRSQIGVAKIAAARGNMPRAERLLDDVIGQAELRDDLSEVHATALQDRAMVSYLRGQYDHSVQLAYRALERTANPVDRDRLLSDIAGAFYMLGLHGAARDAYMIIEATAQEQYQRWAASINLMEIAARDGSMVLFERYRRNLAFAPFAPGQAAQYHLQVAESYEALAEIEPARTAGRRALTIAQEYGFNQVYFQAEALLGRLATAPSRQVTRVERPVPEPLQEIATRLSEMRRLVPK